MKAAGMAGAAVASEPSAPPLAAGGGGGGGGAALPAALPVATALAVDPDAEAAALREQLARQERRLAAQDRTISHLEQLGVARHPGRFVRTEDMQLRLNFLRKQACKLACSPARILPTLLLGWAAMFIFIWCYLWNWGTSFLMWWALQFLHLFSGFNSPFVEYAQHMIMHRAGQQNLCCGLWKSSYKLEGSDENHMYYTV